MKMEAGPTKAGIRPHVHTMSQPKVISPGTFFSGKFALMTYFFQESTVVHPSAFDTADPWWKKLKSSQLLEHLGGGKQCAADFTTYHTS